MALGAISARRNDNLADLHTREIERRAKRVIRHRFLADGEDGHLMVAFRLANGEPLHDALETADASRRQQVDDSQWSRPMLAACRACTPLTAPRIIRFSAAIDKPPGSLEGIVANPIADAFG